MTNQSHSDINERIRRFVDKHGWTLAKADPVLGPIVRKRFAEQREYERTLIELDYETHGGM